MWQPLRSEAIIHLPSTTLLRQNPDFRVHEHRCKVKQRRELNASIHGALHSRVAGMVVCVLCSVRIAGDVISCSGGFWSACWSDVIARMRVVTVANARSDRQLAARSGQWTRQAKEAIDQAL